MAPTSVGSSSSDAEDAPEAVPLSHSKQAVKIRENALNQVYAAEKEKKRQKNKARDRRLKEQAENSKRRKTKRDDETVEAEDESPMQEETIEGVENRHSTPEELTNGEELTGIDIGSDDRNKAFAGGEDNAGSVADYESDNDSAGEDSDRNAQAEPTKISSDKNYLPDHLFVSAFSSKPDKAASKRQKEFATRKTKKRVRSNDSQKDVVIGSRTVRTITTASQGARTAPPAKIQKLVDSSLYLNGRGRNSRGWERRPVNIGIMKRDGPAAHFVRKVI